MNPEPGKPAVRNAGVRAKAARGRGNIGRAMLMSTATKMFLRYGYSGTSMKALANELGVSAPALYWYFPSKEDLYVEVIESAMTDFFAYVAAAADSSDPVRRLNQMVRAHVEWQLNQSDAARTFDLSRAQVEDVSTERLVRVVQLQINYRDSLREVLEQGRAAGVFNFQDVKVTAFAIITLCEYVHSWFNPKGPLTSADVASQFTSLVQQMVGNHSGEAAVVNTGRERVRAAVEPAE